MSTPTNSVAPPYPTGTSSPWPMPLWWKRIADWVAALSPSGASVYDTGWITSGLAVTTTANFTLNSYALRRVGNRATGRLVVTFVGSNLSSNAAGDFANVNVGTLPTGWRPTQYAAPMTMERVGAAVSYGWAEAGGVLRLISSSLQSAVVLANGAQYSIYIDHYVN